MKKKYPPDVLALRELVWQGQDLGLWHNMTEAARVLGYKRHAVTDAACGKAGGDRVKEISEKMRAFLGHQAPSSQEQGGAPAAHLLMQLLRAIALEASQQTVESLKEVLPAELADSIRTPPSGDVLSDPAAVLQLLTGDNQTFATIRQRLVRCEGLMIELIGHFDFLLAQDSNEVATQVGQNLGPCIDQLYARIASSLRIVETRAARGLATIRGMSQ